MSPRPAAGQQANPEDPPSLGEGPAPEPEGPEVASGEVPSEPERESGPSGNAADLRSEDEDGDYEYDDEEEEDDQPRSLVPDPPLGRNELLTSASRTLAIGSLLGVAGVMYVQFAYRARWVDDFLVKNTLGKEQR